MDIKLKNYSRYKAINIMIFILCVVSFISAITLGTFIMSEETKLHGTGIAIDDIFYFKDYKSSNAFQWEFETKSERLLELLGSPKPDRYFRENKKNLDQVSGFTYYASNGIFAVTNIEDYSDGNDVDSNYFVNLGRNGGYLLFENDEMVKSPKSENASYSRIRNNDRYLEERLSSRAYNIYFAFDKNFMDGKEEIFNMVKDGIYRWILPAIILAILSLMSLIWLIVTTGRRDDEGERPLKRVDRVFTEVQLMIITACLVGGGFLFLEISFNSLGYHPHHYGGLSQFSTGAWIQIGGAILLGIFCATIGLLFLLSVIRNLKAGRFMKNSIIFKILAAIFKGIASIYHGGSLMRKLVLLTLAVCLLSATVVLAPVVAILILIFAPKWVKKYEEVRRGIKEVKNGNLTYKIAVTGQGELDNLAADINEISEASHIAIQNELKNQRLKTDLISNVSHDLKTPLTSIITYIDLLKTEGLNSDNGPDYLDVLDQKSKRLQKLTEDLFDAAKASSGAIPVKFERVDMLSLVNQGLGEIAGLIDDSRLDFIVNAKKEKYPVHADGQLLWRLVENLLNNVLKYALEGSRVYIDLKETEGINGKASQVVLEIKNISRDELNINADELMERFKRGDESRATEGSGLGLAIARDLTLLQKGWFEIKIDGDLFKAVVMLPSA